MPIGPADVGVVLLVGLVMAVPGSWYLYKGYRRRDRYRLVRDTPTATPASASAGETVLVTGTVGESDDRIDAPISDAEGGLAAWSILEWQKSVQFRYWSPEARGLRSATVRIECDDGTAVFPGRRCEDTTDSTTSLVGYDAVTGFEVADTLVELDEFSTVDDVAQGSDPPKRFRRLERRVGLDAPDAAWTLFDLTRTGGTRRYRETGLKRGDTITVRATLEAPANPDTPPVLSTPENGPAIVSDLDADALARRYRWTYWKLCYGTVGVILAIMAVAAVAVAL